MLTTQLKPLPWQIENWNSVQMAIRAERMTHAILFTGPVGIGLEHFAKCLTAGLLCENSEDNLQACGDCRSCHLIRGGSHPDLFPIEPEESGKQIRVDEVRKLIDFIHLKSQYGRYKISVITPADAMNRSAANSLLKTLEEPPEQSLLILLSHRPDLLPITIRSRCQKIRFNPAFDEETASWVKQHVSPELIQDENIKHLLTQAGGAPLAIEAMLESNILETRRKLLEDLFALRGTQEDPIKVAERWKTYEPSQVFLWLLQLFADMVRIKLLVQPVRISDRKIIGRLQELIKQLELRELSGFYHLLLENYSLSTGAISYNAQGLLEDVIIFWQNLNDKH
ncbi:MAG: DNA polymerase III subunit delta' [Gammaproteobacteria bacterium]|nr:DNA polymerase III subunit delta' [Gammaproteobacteria bacterium]